ncbi:MAG: UDP-N-acetylglucosamine 2-epimerase (hydrolyzing) [Lachnospiraceae bacterium]|jgi:GDP/UDP-N,N'-diacetylbacillosamine 2-epimerase (hydrolysing)|nr:UDP-N-acetylglucosamine 2-epimerase (hydrolyzing) [Lachnospiraceae bacterium]
MKKICVVTATRAEYGLLRRVIQNIISDDGLELLLVVTGSHLSEKYGNTVNEIEEDGFPIAERIEILEEHATEAGICQTMGNAAIRFGEMYGRQKPDMVIVEGDRYELLSICSSAMVYGIPIAHISGGEITEGAMDDVVRHCITKMSYLHFPACEEYRRRIIQLGEEPNRVFNFGDVGVENVRKMEYLAKAELEQSMGISLDRPYASVTFHPVTLEKGSARRQTEELAAALGCFQELNFIVTMANADLQGDEINKVFQDSAQKHGNIFCYSSLGMKKYLSLIRYAEFVIGNSSSGIVEVPCFGIPTINIGDRQKGRLRADSIIDCEPQEEAIKDSIIKAMSPSFRAAASEAENPYGEGDTASSIVKTIKSFLEEGVVSQKKKFYDVEGGM